METVVERPTALDVHKEQVTACGRVSAGMARGQHVEQFPTTVARLLTLSEWLAAFGVTQVVMEATGVFWRPVWAILEAAFECVLVNARHVKQVEHGSRRRLAGANTLAQTQSQNGGFTGHPPINGEAASKSSVSGDAPARATRLFSSSSMTSDQVAGNAAHGEKVLARGNERV